MVTEEEFSLYFHVPFCRHKCPYCHFYVLPNEPAMHALLHEGLMLELEKQKPLFENKKIVSVYIGGGTPVLFNLDWIPIHGEVTVEANPEEVTYELMSHLKSIGVNRISIGVQSLDDSSLITLGRNHSSNRALEAIETTYRAGIHNISIDLMYDLPNQTVASFERTLKRLKELPITHLSLYNLTIEPHTGFYKQRNSLKLPSSEESLAMHEMAMELIPLNRYEISAFGLPSIHNSGYWTGRPFLGFGPSAFSYLEGRRFRNSCNLRSYVSNLKGGTPWIDFEETLDKEASLRERLAIHLRLIEGVHLSSFDPLPPSVIKDINDLVSEGYLKEDSSLKLTERGLLFYDEVASRLI